LWTLTLKVFSDLWYEDLDLIFIFASVLDKRRRRKSKEPTRVLTGHENFSVFLFL